MTVSENEPTVHVNAITPKPILPPTESCKSQLKTYSFTSLNDLHKDHENATPRTPSSHRTLTPPSDEDHDNCLLTYLFLMILSGSLGDFLGKLIIVILDGPNPPKTDATDINIWAVWMLTTGTVLVCSFALMHESFEGVSTKTFCKIALTSTIDLFVNTTRYLSLLFLNASIISILKTGSQLIFLTIIHHFCRKKMKLCRFSGIMLTLCGIVVVSSQAIFSHQGDVYELQHTTVGVLLILSSGLLGSIRNYMEEILLQDLHLSTNLVIGLEGLIGLVNMSWIGLLLVIWEPKKERELKNLFRAVLEKSDESYLYIVIACFGCFLMVILLKESMQMRVTKILSSLSRKLFEQIYPCVIWILSLIVHFATRKNKYGYLFGEEFHGVYSWYKLGGFCLIIVGTGISYKAKQRERNLEKSKLNDSSNSLFSIVSLQHPN